MYYGCVFKAKKEIPVEFVPDEWAKAKAAAENVNVLLSKEKSHDTLRLDFFVILLFYGRHP